MKRAPFFLLLLMSFLIVGVLLRGKQKRIYPLH